ncbi:MAG: mechanosensitive ion channel family protein [Opitutales bacterium]|nr:mechanosensitive ion channel family protein [Opitutales bacterium]
MKVKELEPKQEIPLVFLLARLWIPVSAFLFFLVSIISKEELLARFLGNASLVVRQVVEYGSQIGLWLSTAFLLQRIVTVFIWDGLISGISGRSVPRLPKDVTGICIFGVALLGILATVFDQSVTGIWATSGVVSIVIGVALRNVILDVFIGLSMHIEKSFQIGDWLMVHQNRRETHIVGQVVEINWRTTRLKTTAKNLVVVPNSKMGEAILTNYMKPDPHFRIDLQFILDYSVSPDRAIRVLMAGVQSVAGNKKILIDPAPEVLLDEALSTGQRYSLRFFILPAHISPKESTHVVNKSVIEHLARAGLAPSMEKEMLYFDNESSLPLIAPEREDNFDEVLTRSELFKVLSEEDCLSLLKKMKRKDLKVGEFLYRQGNAGESFYLLAEGLLCSSIEVPNMEGRAKVERLESGIHFGAEGVLGKGTRLSTISAITDSVVLVFDPVVVTELASRNGDFLSLVNQRMVLGQDRIMKTKWRIQKEEARATLPQKKTGVGRTIQTFFTDFLPFNPPPAKTVSNKPSSS